MACRGQGVCAVLGSAPRDPRNVSFSGFSSVQPCLPLADDFATENVANQKRDKMSILNLYRRLISLRRSRQALQVGSYRPILARAELLLFVRQHGTERVLIALNLGADPTAVDFGSPKIRGRILVSSFADRDGETVVGSVECESCIGEASRRAGCGKSARPVR